MYMGEREKECVKLYIYIIIFLTPEENNSINM